MSINHDILLILCYFVWILAVLRPNWPCYPHIWEFCSKISLKTPPSPPYMQNWVKKCPKMNKKRPFWAILGCFWGIFQNILPFLRNIWSKLRNILTFCRNIWSIPPWPHDLIVKCIDNCWYFDSFDWYFDSFMLQMMMFYSDIDG